VRPPGRWPFLGARDLVEQGYFTFGILVDLIIIRQGCDLAVRIGGGERISRRIRVVERGCVCVRICCQGGVDIGIGIGVRFGFDIGIIVRCQRIDAVDADIAAQFDVAAASGRRVFAGLAGIGRVVAGRQVAAVGIFTGAAVQADVEFLDGAVAWPMPSWRSGSGVKSGSSVLAGMMFPL
jgi:hypothetical protein